MKTCPACGQASPQEARFCPSCGTSLASAAARLEERKVITILFADLVGFTSKAEQLDPEAVRGMLDPYYVQLRTVLERHGGTVEKFIGDAVMAIFGAPVAHEDDAERAVRAAFAIQHAVAAWKAIATRYVRSRREISRAPIVGRESEMAMLRQRWERARSSHRPELLTLLGPPGIGKSRLLREFAGGLDAPVYWGRCLSYGDGITYWPVDEMLRDVAGILHSDKESTMSVKLAAIVDSLGADEAETRTLAMALGTLIGSSTPATGDSRARISRTELHWAIRRLFELMARRGPLALVFEDLHWAEPTLLELIRYIADGADGSILVLGSSRPELVETRPAFVADSGGERCTLALSALTAAQSETLLSELLGPP